MNWANVISNVIAALSLIVAILAWREARRATSANERSVQLAEQDAIDGLIPREGRSAYPGGPEQRAREPRVQRPPSQSS
jgi:Flp pilus assembly protein TadB